MSWEDQGRYYHAWFGSGTSADSLKATVSAPEAIATGAATLLSDGQRKDYQKALDDGAEGAAALQAAARAASGSTPNVAEASENLAKAIASGGTDWRYALSTARDQATYSAVNGIVAKPAELSRAPPVATPVASTMSIAEGSPSVAAGAVPRALAGAEALGLIGTLATGIATGAVVLLWPKPAGESPEALRQLPTVVEARTPKPSGKKGEPIGTHDKPPSGSLPISETPWSGDHGVIKDGIISGATE